MNTIINSHSAETEQDNSQDLSFEELLARSPGGGADQFLMQIEVKSKTLVELLDKYDQPYIEITIDYVTVPKGKRKIKKTRPTFEDGRLIWEQISGEPGIHYVITLTRSSKPKRPYYDWTKIIRLDEDNIDSALINALNTDENSKLAAANDPSFEPVDNGATAPASANDADALT